MIDTLLEWTGLLELQHSIAVRCQLVAHDGRPPLGVLPESLRRLEEDAPQQRRRSSRSQFRAAEEAAPAETAVADAPATETDNTAASADAGTS